MEITITRPKTGLYFSTGICLLDESPGISQTYDVHIELCPWRPSLWYPHTTEPSSRTERAAQGMYIPLPMACSKLHIDANSNYRSLKKWVRANLHFPNDNRIKKINRHNMNVLHEVPNWFTPGTQNSVDVDFDKTLCDALHTHLWSIAQNHTKTYGY